MVLEPTMNREQLANAPKVYYVGTLCERCDGAGKVVWATDGELVTCSTCDGHGELLDEIDPWWLALLPDSDGNWPRKTVNRIGRALRDAEQETEPDVHRLEATTIEYNRLARAVLAAITEDTE